MSVPARPPQPEDDPAPPRVPPPSAPDPGTLDAQEIDALLAAGAEIRECYRVLEKGGLNVVGEILRDQGQFIELEHYPEDEVFDPDTRSQYYYHAHRAAAEHGHFHTFIRTGKLPEPPPPPDPPPTCETWPRGSEAIAHLAGISMDDWGYPIGIFATNRWVTDETWYPGETVIGQLPRFAVDHAYPSWPANRWITAMLRLFRPHVDVLLRHRDVCIRAWQETFPDRDVLEDRRLEITGYLPVSVDAWVSQLRDRRLA